MKRVLAISLFALLAAALSFAADTPKQPAVGSAAPGFTLMNQEGAKVALDQYLGKWIVLYFYPKDFTSGCTIEAHNFQRDLAQYQEKNAVILGVSLDSVDSHKGFCTKEGLNFKLLADTEHKVADLYGSIMQHGDQQYAARNTFLIDPKGVIRKVYIGVDPNKHSEEVLADLSALQPSK
jgi:peroxiredoxin Q/BCP